MKFRQAALVTLACAALASSPAAAENWPQWRGPHHNGTSAEKNLPAEWSQTENVRWRLPLPGSAGSTPVVWEDRVFLTSSEGEDGLALLCVSTEGKPLWKRVVATGNRTVRRDEGNYASPSPVTDGKHVWAFFGTGDLACFDVDGKPVWQINLQEKFGKFKIQFGMTSTPVLDDGRLYLQCMYTGDAYVLALDAADGRVIWKHHRPSDARAECEHSYASPTLYQDDERKFLLSHGADYVIAHSLEDGSELWRCGGLNPKDNYNPTLRLVASPVAVPGLVVVPSAKNGPVLGLRPDARGDVTGVEKWHQWIRPANTPDVPSPLVVDGLVYLCRENGNLICMDAETGEEIYQEPTIRHRHRASPVYADGKIYLAARNGVMTVVKAGRDFEILSQNDMQEEISSSVAIADGTLYIRTFDALYAIGGK